MKSFFWFLNSVLILLLINTSNIRAQELTLKLDTQKSDGTLFFLATIDGVEDFSNCTMNLKFAKGLGNINSGLSQTVYTFTGAQFANFPFGFEFKDIDIVFTGRVYIKATLDCEDIFVIDSNIVNNNFSQGKKRFRNAKKTKNFARFIREVKKSVDYGV